MKSTFTTFLLVWTSSLIIPLGIIVFPSNPTKGTSYLLRSSNLSPKPLNKSGYMIATSLPWSIVTLLTSNPTIRKVIASASLCGWMIPSLLASKNPRIGWSYILSFLSGPSSSSPTDCEDIVTTSLTELESFLEAAKMTFIVPREDQGTPPL